MSFKELIQFLKSDILRYKATGTKSALRIILLYQAFWATGFYRVYQYLYTKTKKSRIARLPVAFCYHIGAKIIQILTMISIPVGARIGKGLHLAHFGPILVSGGTTIGDHCNLGNQVIIGYGSSNGKLGFPTLGDRVFVGPGAKIFGPIKIGNDAAIGANAIVIRDVPDRAVVVGIPAKIINYHGSFRYIFYQGQEKDSERAESFKIACQLDSTLQEEEFPSMNSENGPLDQ